MEFYRDNFYFKKFENILDMKKNREIMRKKKIKKKNEERIMTSYKNKDFEKFCIINISELIRKKLITK